MCNGITPRYQDNEAGQATLHSRGSLSAVAAATGGDLSEVRFRSNIVVDGLQPWEEQGWMGRKVRTGDVDFEVVRRKVRCLATHANPRTGERDVPVMPTLMKAFAQDQPTFRGRLPVPFAKALYKVAFTGKHAHGIANEFMRLMAAHDDEFPPYAVHSSLTGGLRRAAAKAGRGEFLSMWAGQAAGLTRSRSDNPVGGDPRQRNRSHIRG